jgi:glycosyltransferase involved in cell wall biosynthesis
MTTICLNMIVKDEKNVILRCLESVKNIIDYWVIVDTGSRDGTQQIIRDFMQGIPGEVHERHWVNFSHNRNEALALARGRGDYLLFMDADERLILKDFDKKQLKKDAYFTRLKERGNIETYRLAVVKNSPGWIWKDVLHEYIIHPNLDQMKRAELHGAGIDGTTLDGNRSLDPGKSLKDIAILKKALQDDPSNSRYVFYLAQTYACGKEFTLGLEAYQQRATMGGYPPEKFWALYCIGVLQEYLQMAPELFVSSYQAAYQYDPSRAEPLYQIAHYFHRTKQSEAAYPFVKKAAALPSPPPIHALLQWVYEYASLVLFADVAYAIGRKKEAYLACKQLLSKPSLPKEIQDLVERNLIAVQATL